MYQFVNGRQQARAGLVWATPGMMFTALAFLLNTLWQQGTNTPPRHFVGSMITVLAVTVCVLVWFLMREHSRRERADSIWLHIVERSKFQSARLRKRLARLKGEWTSRLWDVDGADLLEVTKTSFAWKNVQYVTTNDEEQELFDAFMAIHSENFAGQGYLFCCNCKVSTAWQYGIAIFGGVFAVIWLAVAPERGY